MSIERPTAPGTADPSRDQASPTTCATFSTILEQLAAELEEEGEELAHSVSGSIAPPAEEPPTPPPPACLFPEPAPVPEPLIDDRPAVFDRARSSAFVGAPHPGSRFLMPGVEDIEWSREFDTRLFTPIVLARPPVIGRMDVSAVLLDGGPDLRSTLLRVVIFAADGAPLADVFARLDLWGRRRLIIDGDWSHMLIGLAWDPLRPPLGPPPSPDDSVRPGGADNAPHPRPEPNAGGSAPPLVEPPLAEAPAPDDASVEEQLQTGEDPAPCPFDAVREAAGEPTVEKALNASESDNAQADSTDVDAETEAAQDLSLPNEEQARAQPEGTELGGDEPEDEALGQSPDCEQAAGTVGGVDGSDDAAPLEEAAAEAPGETVAPESGPGDGRALLPPLPVVVDRILIFPPILKDGPSLTLVGSSHAYVFTPLQDGSYLVGTVGGALLGTIRDVRSVKFEDGTYSLARLAHGGVRARLGPGEDVRDVLVVMGRGLPRVASEDDEAAAQVSAAEVRRALQAAQNRLRGLPASPSSAVPTGSDT